MNVKRKDVKEILFTTHPVSLTVGDEGGGPKWRPRADKFNFQWRISGERSAFTANQRNEEGEKRPRGRGISKSII